MSTRISSKHTLQYLFLAAGGFLFFRAQLSATYLLLVLFLAIILFFGYMANWLLLAAYTRRKLTLLSSDEGKEFLGEPLLFPSRLSHARRFPESERYNYWYDYFMVGIPVGLQGRIGILLSIDNLPAHEGFREKCWFTIDPKYYLDRGSGDRSLREKLDMFLKSQGLQAQEFPHAYLFSVPRFLWWQKSAISYWYLYSPSRELTAMIMEINNSFYEKRNVFFRLNGDDHVLDASESTEEKVYNVTTKGGHELHELHFISSKPRSKHYKGSWEKLIFASPFEKVEGSMAASFVDPLQPEPNPKGPLQSNLSSLTPDGKVKVTSRLSSWDQPVSPLSGPSWVIAKMLLRWTHVGVLSAFRIVKEALRIRFRGNLQYLQRPEVRRGSTPRKETEVERVLEQVFREYLCQLSSHHPSPLAVVYTPPKSLHFDLIHFHSPVPESSSSRPTLTIQPLTPRFYTSITHYDDAYAGFTTTTTSFPTNSDHSSCQLWVSDQALMTGLLDSAGLSLAQNVKFPVERRRRPWLFQMRKMIIAWLRKRQSDNDAFLDRFTYQNLPPSTQSAYQKAIIHHLLAQKLPVESQAIVLLCYIVTTMTVIYILLHALRLFLYCEFGIQIDELFSPRMAALLYGGWAMYTKYIGKYYLNPFGWGEGL
ncbi:hypothetical protein N7499_009189 [Penicillium canescens]|nr:hypothetical protein N7499_009189 [Penicillium canescens]KAJ6169857.1 hypothetical protein N7485_007203 [Penicillium canescens]